MQLSLTNEVYSFHFERITLVANGIALIVEEPAPGQFYWVLEAQQIRAAREARLDRAARPMPSYGLAVMAGIAALEQRAGVASSGRQGRLSEHAVMNFGPTTIAGTI
ncbi:hypothetical protein [Variovorax rhizosphaerae]|uniref:Uncharacterized protein n=1 Tax=Variovorax rhizosphaerae TaxID=1836200 RepID=A0ABU8WE38_9BURK